MYFRDSKWDLIIRNGLNSLFFQGIIYCDKAETELESRKGGESKVKGKMFLA